MKKGIVVRGKKITSLIVISTIGGHWGFGLMPLVLSPKFMKFMRAVRETNTVQLLKSSTHDKHRGHFQWYDLRTYKYVQRIGRNRRSLLNAYAHDNLGVSINIHFIRVAVAMGYKIVVNIAPDFSKNLDEVIRETIYDINIAVSVLGNKLIAIEIVPSCGNREYCRLNNGWMTAEIIRAVRKIWSDVVIIIKKGLQHSTEDVLSWQKSGMDVCHGINTVSHDIIYPGWISPLADVGGGTISGEDIREIAFEDNCKTRSEYDGPMIFGGGVSSRHDAWRCFEIGKADAVSITTVARLNSDEAVKMLYAYNR